MAEAIAQQVMIKLLRTVLSKSLVQIAQGLLVIELVQRSFCRPQGFRIIALAGIRAKQLEQCIETAASAHAPAGEEVAQRRYSRCNICGLRTGACLRRGAAA